MAADDATDLAVPAGRKRKGALEVEWIGIVEIIVHVRLVVRPALDFEHGIRPTIDGVAIECLLREDSRCTEK